MLFMSLFIIFHVTNQFKLNMNDVDDLNIKNLIFSSIQIMELV